MPIFYAPIKVKKAKVVTFKNISQSGDTDNDTFFSCDEE
jgi:hypothetical protein